MFLSRLSRHVKNQNWVAVVLDFIIVVAGIFVGLQVSNWSAKQQSIEIRNVYYQRLQADLKVDFDTISRRQQHFQQVMEYATTSLELLNSKDKVSQAEQWSKILALFQASQIWTFIPSSPTYSELQSTGSLNLIDQPKLLQALDLYYDNGSTQLNLVAGGSPEYRTHIRGKLPWNIQTYIWQYCHSRGAEHLDSQQLLDCKRDNFNRDYNQLITQLREDTKLKDNLRSWMSTIKITMELYKGLKEEIDNLNDLIEQQLPQSKLIGNKA
ncbi:DUF6090 family protein [Thalassotalea crassostreae]|uniref:DUF6090 family protein n=1 Tax=Thalassotalea crassostreae TaxID=1763536 RepID=UPI000838CA84|nr:DUF6090 family protein [Thalassotalea crassostreae]